MGTKYCIAWTCLVYYEHRERPSFRKSIADLCGRIRCSQALYVCSISWFLVWSAAIVGEEPG